ncbi:uncharacterized protein MELLADRAFT_64462 [Melampsora larici-populina 98AG31]|uniref:Uncharacterized protein n=1 Tax=Melampsora larici-populina (strain 98AG31 / pathotype 3-4-7) TaxID=747676 RepID=F4RRI5_MELLP|nr:uncharacterized protein MELLADRAFT_64462 [Melampsora larici-populina 98AG31]EGG05023.1 hypothetical protein MELLADRAFT_64462 [Melampsora larici-populina 98AG31]
MNEPSTFKKKTKEPSTSKKKMKEPPTSKTKISNATPESSTDDLQTPCRVPKLKSNVTELREGLVKSFDKMASRQFTQSQLVKLKSHVTGKQSKGVMQPGDYQRPHIVSLEETSKKDRDTIRKALHCYCPQLWIPLNVAESRPMLLALYNHCLLDEEEPTLCQGVHYDIFPIE